MEYFTMNGMLYPLESDEIRCMKDIEYLFGYNMPGTARLFGKLEKNRIPLLACPLQEHLNAVNKFLFDGGIMVDSVDATPEDPRQIWLDRQLEHMGIQSKLTDLWERGAITGELFLGFWMTKDPDGNMREIYDVQMYDRSEYVPVYDAYNNLIEVKVFSVYAEDGEDYVHKVNYTREAYIKWPKMTLYDCLHKELPDPEEYPHEYRDVPGVILRNGRQIDTMRGTPEFNYGAIDMACEIAIQVCDAASNYHYFGDPKILSADPRVTLKEIQRRSQVLSKSEDERGGAPEFMEITPVPSGHPKFIENLTRNLRNKLGSPLVDASGASDGTSSLTLRLLHTSTISTAQNKWKTYVDEGLAILFKKMLIAAAYDGILGNVNPMDSSTSMITVRRAQPFFPRSPQEMQTAATLADSLIAMGVKREIALKQVFPELTSEQILDMLEGDF
ncbi:virion structural protein [Acaryochloris phage A-HIS2]|nr:virion structural protein [Acaryochloris phage A-HIS2]